MNSTVVVALELDRALSLLQNVSRPQQLFGPPGADEQAARAAQQLYRQLVRALYPDLVPSVQRDEATKATAELNRLYDEWRRLAGQTGSGWTVATRRRSYRVDGPPIRGDIANLYRASWEQDGQPISGLLKMPRRPADSDLARQEASALRALQKGDLEFADYVPGLVDSFRHRDSGSGRQRQVNVLAEVPEAVTLADVLRAFPGGLDPRDAAWMWRRLLVAVGLATRSELVHLAVIPENVLIVPESHGLVLLDWCYSVAVGGKASAWVGGWRQLYPPEVLAGQPVSPATDIYMATRLMGLLMGAGAPAAMRGFVAGCTLAQPGRRPQDAWELLRELDELLVMLYGPRKFRPFRMPAVPGNTKATRRQ